jgi:hypothetical protein
MMGLIGVDEILYMLKQKGLLVVREECGFQAVAI